MANNMDDISDELVRTTLLARTTFSNEKVNEIGARLRYVTEMMEKLPSPPCDGDFLMIIKNNEPHFWYFIQSDKNTIGRDDSNDIELWDNDISRTHCRVNKVGSDWEIVDNNSSNGFRVNAATATSRILCDGDLISMGSYEVIFVVNKPIEY